MIPEHRLAQLLTQIKDHQIESCMYHNTPEVPSLYVDHICDRNDFPLQDIAEIDTHKDEVWHLKFSNDGTKLATASKDRSVAIHEMTTFTTTHVFKDHSKPVTYVAWSPDDRYLLSCSMDCEARIWDVEVFGAAIDLIR